MLPPSYFENCADDILELYTQLDDAIVRDIAQRLVKYGGVTSATEWQVMRLQESGLLLDDIITKVSAITSASNQQVKSIFEDAGIEAVEWDSEIYEAAGLTPMPIRLSPAAVQVLQAGLRKTAGQIRNLTLTTAMQAQQTYINAATMAEMQIESGAFSYATAIRNAIKQAASQGATVQYPKGHISRLDVAIRRAVLTGVNQTCAEISLKYAEDMDCDLVETTAHHGARPTHMEWQGKVFSLNGPYKDYEDFKTATGYDGDGTGLCGWNCRHSFYPFFEGLSESAYPKEKLEAYEKQTVKFNGEDIPYYDATQKQRAYERDIRATKRDLIAYDAALKKAATDELRDKLQQDFDISSVKLKAQEGKLKDFVKQTGLQKDSNRVQTLGFDRSTAQKAVWADKKVSSFTDKLIGLETPSGIKINVVSKHVFSQAKMRDVTVKDVADALTSPLKTGKIRTDRSQQFTGEHATVVINVDTGKVITTWRTSRKKPAKMKGDS